MQKTKGELPNYIYNTQQDGGAEIIEDTRNKITGTVHKAVLYQITAQGNHIIRHCLPYGDYALLTPQMREWINDGLVLKAQEYIRDNPDSFKVLKRYGATDDEILEEAINATLCNLPGTKNIMDTSDLAILLHGKRVVDTKQNLEEVSGNLKQDNITAFKREVMRAQYNDSELLILIICDSDPTTWQHSSANCDPSYRLNNGMGLLEAMTDLTKEFPNLIFVGCTAQDLGTNITNFLTLQHAKSPIFRVCRGHFKVRR